MKTKIGISAGAYAALTFLLALYGGFTPILLAAGYVLLFESNEWLKTTVVKAVVIMLAFDILSTLLGVIPDLLGWISGLLGTFRSGFSYAEVSGVFTFISRAAVFLERIIFLLLALYALKMKTINIGFVDKFVTKHLNLNQEQ